MKQTLLLLEGCQPDKVRERPPELHLVLALLSHHLHCWLCQPPAAQLTLRCPDRAAQGATAQINSSLRWQLSWISPLAIPSQHHSGSHTSQVLGFPASSDLSTHFSASGGLVSEGFSNLDLLTLLFQTFIFRTHPTFT